MKTGRLETTIKVSGELQNVEIVQDKLCNLWPCSVSPMRESHEGGYHIYITIVSAVEEVKPVE